MERMYMYTLTPFMSDVLVKKTINKMAGNIIVANFPGGNFPRMQYEL